MEFRKSATDKIIMTDHGRDRLNERLRADEPAIRADIVTAVMSDKIKKHIKTNAFRVK